MANTAVYAGRKPAGGRKVFPYLLFLRAAASGERNIQRNRPDSMATHHAAMTFAPAISPPTARAKRLG